MSEYKKIILKINNYLTSKHIITDIGSSKKNSDEIIRKNLKEKVFWSSSHPIAGSEVSGPENGKQNLFENKWCVLIKGKRSNKKHLKILNNFWKKMGSKTVVMSPEKHDKIFSITSHLPHLIAYNLVKSAQDFEKILKFNLIKYSAGGLRDFSRIAASNEIMWRDIFFDNKVNITKAIDLFIKNLKSFKKDINKKNNKSILKKLTQTKKVRSKIIKLKQDINKPDFGRSN
jgi:prephenate dehydrogenase/cyclohexadieny/prephenate dehydrogenase